MQTLNLQNPTDPSSYQQLGHIIGLPLYWHNCTHPAIPQAIQAYLEQRATAQQLKFVIAYLQHLIHAPCWLEAFPSSNGPAATTATEIAALRQFSLTMTTVEQVNHFINRALDINIDPL